MSTSNTSPLVNGTHVPAATYEEGTFEYKILNEDLPKPPVRVDRAGAHTATPLPPRERFRGGVRSVIKIGQLGQSFHYSKLRPGEIRLLCLHQGKADNMLSANLFARKLDDVKGRYEALSYTWGTERPKEYIFIKDLSATVPATQKKAQTNLSVSDQIFHLAKGHSLKTTTNAQLGVRFPIKRNLWQALRKLRKEATPVYLWVDALCIDQSEAGKDEKEGQLQKMAEIYNSAANVCIWLGDGFAGAEEGIRMIKDIMNLKMFDKALDTEDSRARWPFLVGLMKAPWFSRRWIIQEIAFSRNAVIFCNDFSIHWDDFADAVSLLIEKIELIRARFRNEVFNDIETSSATTLVLALTNICRKTEAGDIRGRLLDLETLVSTFLRFEASFARDTIYSILSLAKDRPPKDDREPWWEELHDEQLKHNDLIRGAARSRRGSMTAQMREHEETMDQKKKDRGIRLVPNYNMSTRDLFIAFVTRCIKQSKSLDIICRHWAPEIYDTSYGDVVTLPSWISSIAESPYGGAGRAAGRQNGENFVSYWPGDQRQRYSASGGREADIRMVIDPSLDPVSKAPKRTPQPSPFEIGQVQQLLNAGHQNSSKNGGLAPVPEAKSTPTPKISKESQSLKSRRSMEVIEEEQDTSAGAEQTEDSPAPERKDFASNQVSDDAPAVTPQSPPVPPKRQSLRNAETNRSVLNGSQHSALPAGDQPPVNDTSKQFDRASSKLNATRPVLSLSPRAAPSIKVPQIQAILDDFTEVAIESSPQTPSSSLARKEDVERRHMLSGVLAVKGIVVGVVRETSDAMRGGIVPGDWVNRMGWHIETNNKKAPEVLWRLLTADRTDKGGKPPQWYKRACLHGLVDPRVSDAEGNLHSKMHDEGHSISEQTTRFFERVAKVVWNRRLLRIDCWPELGGPHFSHFGLGPNKAEKDDLVCILFGCSVPVVLRQLEHARIHYACEVIGECYVDALMDGDAVEDKEFVKKQTSEFYLI